MLFHSQNKAGEKTVIRIFTTGGTMDGVGCSGEGCNCKAKTPPTTSRVPQLLSEARAASAVEMKELFIKNSSKFTDEDRDSILQACLDTPEERIVITHGTQTMCETARFLGEHNISDRKTIVLTGAMKSTLEEQSDGSFNLGFAIASTMLLEKGVYVAMHGRIFPWNNVQLVSNPKRFEAL